MLCDIFKQTSSNSKLKPLVFSLSSNYELISAISNDISYDEVFSYQLERIASKKDLLITISSSGNSENIVRVLKKSKEMELYSVALTGFSGGRSKEFCSLNIHVPEDNYGIVEDAHQSIIHSIAQFLRKKYLDDDEDENKIVF